MTKLTAIRISDYFYKTTDNMITQYYKCKHCPDDNESIDLRWKVRKYTGRRNDDNVRSRPDMKRMRDHAKKHRKEFDR